MNATQDSSGTTPMAVVFGRPGAGKSALAEAAVDLVKSSPDNTTIHVLGLDLDVCVPQWMRDKFAAGLYPTLQERQIFAKAACEYVQEQQDKAASAHNSPLGVIVSFSFVNTDLRETFQQRFPDAQWYLLNTSEEVCAERIQKRQGHFYKGKVGNQTGKSNQNKRKSDNSEWEFAPVDFDHVLLDGDASIEWNAKIVAKGLLNLVQNGAPSSPESLANPLPQWPSQAAARTRLLVPRVYQKHWRTNVEYCTLRLDAARGLLQVVAETSGGNNDQETILDVWDVEDMIGADLQIEGLLSTESNDESPQGPTTTPLLPSDRLVDRQGRAVLNIYVYPRQKPDSCLSLLWCGSGNAAAADQLPPNPPSYQRPTDLAEVKEHRRSPHHRSFVLAPAEDLGDANLVWQGLRRLANGRVDVSEDDRPRVLVLCSPVSGPRKDGPVVLERVVRPMLSQAGIKAVDTLITTHAGHARERMAVRDINDNEEPDVTTYTGGILVMGGDGMLSEVVNGLYERPDAETAVAAVKVGLVPCGTANGLVASLAYHCAEVDDLTTALFMIAKNRTISLDLSEHQTQDGGTAYGFLSYTYGTTADIDIKSEVIRWMGSLRYDIWGALMVLRMPRYRARFTYLPPDKAPQHKTRPVGAMPATLDQSIPASSHEWVTLEEDFLFFWPTQLSHVAKRTFLSPDSKVQDGLFKVMLIRAKKVSRLRFALILIGLETGTHTSYDDVVEVVDCCAYRLEPLTPGLSVLDGEVLPPGPIQSRVLPASLKVFCHRPTN